MNVADYLVHDNPRLTALEEAYRRHQFFEDGPWLARTPAIDLRNFRGESVYLSQIWCMSEERYQATYDHAVSLGLGKAIALHGEDDAFGCITHQRGDIVFSRDLLDSVFEIDFLVETLGLHTTNAVNLLDIGAGYGRLVHRFSQAFTSGSAYGVDGIALSTFLCEFYLQYRGCPAMSVPLTDLDSLPGNLDIAANAYSFSEMPLSAVRFWLARCADLNIRYFFLVPHAYDLVHPHFSTSEPGGVPLNYWPLFAEHGYRLIRQRPKFPEHLTPGLIYSTDYFLWERR